MASWQSILQEYGAIDYTPRQSESEIADLIRWGDLSREDVSAITSSQLQRLGGYQYMQLYPEVYQPGYKWWQDVRYGVSPEMQSAYGSAYRADITGTPYIRELNAELNSLQALKDEFPGVEATYIRWFLDKRMGDIKDRLSSFAASCAEARRIRELRLARSEQGAIEAGTFVRPQPGQEGYSPEGIYGEERIQAEGLSPTTAFSGSIIRGTRETTPPPVPEWMMPYLEPSIAYEKPTLGTEYEKWRAGAYPEPATATLRPIGAQAKLGPTELGQMAGYEAWGRAGAPYTYSEKALMEMADWERWWSPYTRLSQSLFPAKTKLTPRWLPAYQR